MFSNRYIFIYSTIMVIVVATMLAAAANLLKPRQMQNIEIEKIQNILAPAGIVSEYATAKSQYAKYVTKEIVVNSKGEEVSNAKAFDIDLYIENKKPFEQRNLGIFVITHDNGEINFVVPVRGKGLWGPIWGYLAFKDDLNTIKGVRFDHKGETPGLGAEINTTAFQEQFVEEQILNDDGEFISIIVWKGKSSADDKHGVDGISGGTITSKGLEDMLREGLTGYTEYFKKLRTTSK